VDLPMLAASVLFSATTAYGAVVAVREDLPDEPFGWRPPGKVSTHELLGLGSGAMAPWPMPVAAVIAALKERPGSTVPAQVSIGIGSACLVGTVVEPVTWGRRSTSRATTITTALNLLSGTALVLAGRRAVIASRELSAADSHRRVGQGSGVEVAPLGGRRAAG
jgi:hypothetical protein